MRWLPGNMESLLHQMFNSDKTDIVSTQVIDGRQCLVIKIDERLEVNGISVNPDTGEVIDRTAEGYVEE